jgi:PAS domain S-box-containing protein
MAIFIGTVPPPASAARPSAIRVVMDNNYPPFSFKDGAGNQQGILIDQWRLWERQTGIKVEILAMEWSKAVAGMKEGQYDVIDTLFKTEERSVWLDFTKPYTTIEVPIFFDKDIGGITDAASLKGFVVADKRGDAMINILKRSGVENLQLFDSFEALVQAAKAHQVNVFVMGKPPALHLLNKYGINDRFRQSAPLHVNQFCRAVTKGNSELLKIVDDGFAALPPEQLKSIETKWYGASLVNRFPTTPVVAGIGGLCLLVLILLALNRTLKKAVARRTLELQRSEESLRLTSFTVEHIADSVFLIAADATIIEANKSACRLSGYTRDELLTLKVFDIDTNYGVDVWQQHWEELKANGSLFFESSQRTKNGDMVPIEVTANFICFNNREYNCAFVRDISERKKMVRLLAESEVRLHTVVQTIPDLIWLKDVNGVYLACNPNFERFFGASEAQIVGKTDYDFVDKELADFFREHDRKAMAAGKPSCNEEWVAFADDGHRALLETIKTPMTDAEGQLVGVLGIARDISDRKKAEEDHINFERQLLHTQKLESLGILSGGIAHDFNNLLLAVLGNLDLALMRLPAVTPARNNIDQAIKAGRHAAKLTNMMLAYSGKGIFVIKPLNLTELVDENATMLEAAIPKSISLEQQLDHALPIIRADAGQLQQVIMNLITNAAEAIGDQRGKIRLATGVATFDRHQLEQSRLEEKPAAGLYVWLEVRDNGCGMDEETLQKLFDPFFTTKFTGRGLGMSAVLGIIRAHKGAFLVESRPAVGTNIKVLFPVAADAPAISSPSGENAPLPDIRPVSSNRVLVVDDEEMIRGVTIAMLEELGFEALAAASGEEALTLFCRESGNIDVVLLDQVMPDMDGVSVFKELRRIRPDIKVLLASGFSRQEVAERFSGLGLNGFLQKPYTLNILTEELTRLLGEGTL